MRPQVGTTEPTTQPPPQPTTAAAAIEVADDAAATTTITGKRCGAPRRDGSLCARTVPEGGACPFHGVWLLRDASRRAAIASAARQHLGSALCSMSRGCVKAATRQRQQRCPQRWRKRRRELPAAAQRASGCARAGGGGGGGARTAKGQGAADRPATFGQAARAWSACGGGKPVRGAQAQAMDEKAHDRCSSGR